MSEQRTIEQRLEALREDIRASVNRNSLENVCDVPDFIIAGYLMGCFDAFVKAACMNGEWHSDR